MQTVRISGIVDSNGRILPLKCTDNGDGTGTLKIDGELTAAIDPSTLATAANQILTYKGQDRTATTGAAEEITIPTGSKRAYISCDPSSKGNLNINADATTSSFYISSHRDFLAVDLLGVTKLSTWMVAGNATFLFFG